MVPLTVIGRAVAGSGGECHLGDRVAHAGRVRDDRAGERRAQRARTDRQAVKIGVVGGRWGSTREGNSIGLGRHRVLGSNCYREGVGAHIQVVGSVAGAAGHGGAVDCYRGRAVAGSGGECHLGDRVAHAGRVRDDRAGERRAQRARTDRQAVKIGVVGGRWGSTREGNSIGLGRHRVLGSNCYREGVGAHIQVVGSVAGAAGHGGAVDCYRGRAVAGSGGECHLGDRVAHAGRVRDDRAGERRAQRARTDRQAVKIGVVGGRWGSTREGNSIGLGRHRVLGSNCYREGVGAHIQVVGSVAGAAGHGGAVDCYRGRAVAGSGGECHLGDRVAHAGRVRDDRAGERRAQRARTDRQAVKIGVVGGRWGSTREGNSIGLGRHRVLGSNCYREGVVAHIQVVGSVAGAAGHGGAVDRYRGRAVAGSGGECHLGDRVAHAGRVRDDRAGERRAQRARTDRQAVKIGVVGGRWGSTREGNSIGLGRHRVLGGNCYREGVVAHIQVVGSVAGAAGHGGAVDCYRGRAVAGSGGECHLGDRVAHAGRVRDDRAGERRAQRARTDRQAVKIGVVGGRWGSTREGNSIGLGRHRVLGSNCYREGVGAHIQVVGSVAGAAGHGGAVVDRYRGRAVAGSGGECHLGDRVAHAGRVRDDRAGERRAQRARTDRQAVKIGVVGGRWGSTREGNSIGLGRHRVLGSNCYREGVVAHIQVVGSVAGAAGHGGAVVDRYRGRAVAGSGGECHLGDRVAHAGRVRDDRAGERRAQRARTDRQAVKIGVVGGRWGSTREGNSIGLGRHRVLGSNCYREGVGRPHSGCRQCSRRRWSRWCCC